MRITHAPIAGIERYKPEDFASGKPIQLLIVDATRPLAVPNGSYVVKAQFKPGAVAGKATLTDRNGKIVATRELLVRTRARGET